MKMPEWLSTLKAQESQRFFERGLPTAAEERWKYMPSITISHSDALIHEIQSYNNFGKLFDKQTIEQDRRVIFCNLYDALSQYEDKIKPYLSEKFDSEKFPFAVLNTAELVNGIFLYVPENMQIKLPFHAVYNNGSASIRTLIVLEKNSECIFVEEHQADVALKNCVTQIFLDNNSHLHFYKLQKDAVQTTHLANIFVSQKQDSRFHSFGFDIGGRLVREDITVSQHQKGAVCELNGLYQLSENSQFVDNHLAIQHLAGHCESSIFYKGILDKKSKAVFNGRVFVQKDAQQIIAYQGNHNLLISSEAEVNTKPELEIYANDVRCAHGATVGQIDQAALFYLCSRGIAAPLAKKILIQAFADSIINKIPHDTIKQYIAEWIDHEEL